MKTRPTIFTVKKIPSGTLLPIRHICSHCGSTSKVYPRMNELHDSPFLHSLQTAECLECGRVEMLGIGRTDDDCEKLKPIVEQLRIMVLLHYSGQAF